jgi:hypothetical protein
VFHQAYSILFDIPLSECRRFEALSREAAWGVAKSGRIPLDAEETKEREST